MKISSTLFFLFVSLTHLDAGFASILPKDQALRARASDSTNVIDPLFQKWLNQHANQKDIFKLDGKEFDGKLNSLDSVTKSYILFQIEQRKDRKSSASLEAYNSLKNELKNYKDSNKTEHPMLPNIMLEIMNYDRAVSYNDDFYNLLSGKYPRSCVHKKYVGRSLSDPAFLVEQNIEAIIKMLGEAKNFESYVDRRSFLKHFLTLLPLDLRPKVAEHIWPLVENEGFYKANFPWIFAGSSKSEDEIEHSKDAEQLKRMIRAEKCHESQEMMQKMLLNTRTKFDLSWALEKTTAIGNCIKRKGEGKRIKVWEDLRPSLEKRFAKEGALSADFTIARYEWNRDNFTAAISLLDKVKLEASKAKLEKLSGDAHYLLAKIYENQSDLKLATEAYTTFVEKFPKHEKFVDAVSALLLVQVSTGNWQEVIATANKIIYPQEEIGRYDQDSSVLGFALFWRGRAEIEVGKTDIAVLTWNRLATEFYSTYYGAMGHYLLELQANKKWVIQPPTSGKFDEKRLFASYNEMEKDRIERIKILLQLGQQTEANCEILELSYNDDESKKLVSALFKYSVGEWLPAIKLYSELPRNLRDRLPRGMETILFPRKYENEILSYASKLSVDPDLVFALIRQESVYNPLAKSPVGAHGLMQLMPNTAKLEMRKLKENYGTESKRQNINAAIQSEENLFDIDTNLFLGIHHLDRLLESYGTPVMTLAAYNAGPGAVARWTKQYPTNDLLYFIERIPYSETQQYVKLIMRNYFYYKHYYRGEQQAAPYMENITRSLTSSEKWETINYP